MENQFVPYEETKKLIELGFDEPTLAHYITTTNVRGRNSLILSGVFRKKDKRDLSILSAPLYQQAFNFFREHYSTNCEIICEKYPDLFGYTIEDYNGKLICCMLGSSYNEVRLQCLETTINTIQTRILMENNLNK